MFYTFEIIRRINNKNSDMQEGDKSPLIFEIKVF